jgi:outer membrane protein assembly factor BamB
MVSNFISHRAAIGEDGTVYVNDANGILHAILPDGTELWTYNGTGAGSQGPTVIGDDGTIYFGTASLSAVHAVNPDGTLKWMFVAPDSQGIIGGPGIGPDGNVYAVFDTPGDIGAVGLTPDGVLLWNELGNPRVSEFGQVGRELVFAADQFYWTSDNLSELFAFDLATGNQEFDVTPASPGQADVGKKGTVFVPTGIAPRLQAYTAEGDFKWEFFGNEPGITNVLSAPDVALDGDGPIYINRNISTLYSLTQKATVRWTKPSLVEQGPVGGPIVNPTNTVVMIGGQETFGKPGLLIAYDPDTGAKLFKLSIPKEPDGSCAVPFARPTFTDDGLRAYVPMTQLCTSPPVIHSYLYAIDITL